MALPTPETPTAIAGVVLAITKALESKGIDSQKLLQQAQITRSITNDPLDRIPNSVINKLFQLSVVSTNDPCFGLYAGKFMHLSNMHALGYALFSSSTLLEFCKRLSRRIRFFTQNSYCEVAELDDEVKVEGTYLVESCYEAQDMFLSFMLNMMRLLYKADFAPLQVKLMRPEPKTGPEPYREFFRAPVTFGNDIVSLCFNREHMVAPLSGGCPELAQYNDDIIANALARLERSDIASRTEAVLVEILSEGHITKEKVANRLNMSPSTLKLKLSQKGTSYRELLEKVRKEHSLVYVAKQDMPVGEIAYRLGFADASIFSRTFKRWTGYSPSHYRSKL